VRLTTHRRLGGGSKAILLTYLGYSNAIRATDEFGRALAFIDRQFDKDRTDVGR